LPDHGVTLASLHTSRLNESSADSQCMDQDLTNPDLTAFNTRKDDAPFSNFQNLNDLFYRVGSNKSTWKQVSSKQAYGRPTLASGDGSSTRHHDKGSDTYVPKNHNWNEPTTKLAGSVRPESPEYSTAKCSASTTKALPKQALSSPPEKSSPSKPPHNKKQPAKMSHSRRTSRNDHYSPPMPSRMPSPSIGFRIRGSADMEPMPSQSDRYRGFRRSRSRSRSPGGYPYGGASRGYAETRQNYNGSTDLVSGLRERHRQRQRQEEDDAYTRRR